ncbi:CDP-alcohol phosphatidyltransferase family protein [Streptomyces sp. KK5PA1]|uniref:CDP-alcohol phosphatidyltransferase family protein n=1 Tax=Actinacidiphila acididurans TaxID=2784346 RepID=A0ABS2TX98_9ACTN|nr:CDP-alcohol phosphatidyltransferase family protein [Actinacidiphila acididurans]
MSTAVLTGPSAAGPASTLAADLRALGFDVAEADTPEAVAARLAQVPPAERVALVDRRFLGHRHALRLALTDPRFDTAAIPGALSATAAGRPALLRALAAVSGARPAPSGGATSLPAPTRVGGAGLDELPDPHIPSAGGRAGLDRSRVVRSATRTAAADIPLPDALADALGPAGAEPHRPELGVLVATVPTDETARQAAAEAIAAVDEESIRLRSAVKSRDGFFTTHFISPYSRYIARWCARRGLTPNQVTTASLLVALIAAGCAATGTRGGFVAAGVLLLASFVLDCTDGQLARYSLQYSTLGAWLDATFDRVKEYAYYAGLALGAARGGDDVWALALGAMVLQTCRHVVDFAFNEANHDASANTSPTAALSGRLDSVGWTVWARRMIVLPIGERWALIAVLTAATTPRTTFVVLLIGCGLAACYTTAGRVLRSLTRKARRTDRAARALDELCDSGPLAEAAARPLARFTRALPVFAPPALALAGGAVLTATAALAPRGSWGVPLAALVYVFTSAAAVSRPLKGPLDWLVPPLFRAAEYGTVLALAAVSQVNGALPAAFGLVAAVAYHHYDTVYRIRGGTGAPPRALVRAAGGHEGRALVVAVLAAACGHHSGFAVALTVLAVCLALLVLAESIRFWVSSSAPAVHDETGEPA